jgi:hypothetical protein
MPLPEFTLVRRFGNDGYGNAAVTGAATASCAPFATWTEWTDATLGKSSKTPDLYGISFTHLYACELPF